MIWEMCIRDSVGGGDAGQLDLGLLSGLLQALHGNLVAAQVDALGLLKDVYKRQGEKNVSFRVIPRQVRLDKETVDIDSAKYRSLIACLLYTSRCV